MASPSTSIPADDLTQCEEVFRALVFSSSLFRDVDEATKNRIVESATLQRFEQGSTLIRQGELGESLYLVLSGTVRVETVSGTTTVALAELGKGACVGEVALVSDTERTATVRAVTTVDCGRIDVATLRKAMEGSPALTYRMQQLIEARAQDTVEKIIGE